MTALGCSFTGHRQIPLSNEAALKDLVRRAVAYAYEEGCRNFFAGGAIGFDTLAAREVLLFRMTHADVRLVLLLPCPEQAEGFSERDRAAYEYILASADEVRYLAQAYDKTCMKRRNEALVAACDILIAYMGRDRSGAGQTVRMAQRAGKRVYNLFSETQRICRRDLI